MATVTCPGCLERDAELADLKRRVAELEALVRELTARLGANATNSSTPPSANPPQAPKPVTKAPTGKKPGAQPGHPAHLKRRLPPERVTRTLTFIPERCTHGLHARHPVPPRGPRRPTRQEARAPACAAPARRRRHRPRPSAPGDQHHMVPRSAPQHRPLA